ncbi:MAG: hypothetical protein KGJ64_05985 [Betaproteobacteria bacterium]|nr:hypothetical protein [Betaproteobacteria bacterium]
MLALPARAGSDQSAANVGRAANAGGSASGAMQWARHVDHLTTLLDHLQRIWKYGPYSERNDLPVKPASSPGDKGLARPTQPIVSTGLPPRSPQPGSSSTRACTYPAGYPRVSSPTWADALGTTPRIQALIIKEIPSHADAPTAPDLDKWRRDSLQQGLTLEAGPVFGAYLVKLPRRVSDREATAIIRQMYIADMADSSATPGCLYDYVIPDLPMKTMADTGPSFPPDNPPQVATSAYGSIMLDTGFSADNRILGSFSEITARDIWPLLGAWANTAGAEGQPPHPLAATALAVIDPTFYAVSAASRPIPVRYSGPIVRVTRDDEPGDTQMCQSTSSKLAWQCHGDIVAAVIGQDVRQFQDSTGTRVLGGGSLGRGLYYRGAPGDSTTSRPLFGAPDMFPIERIETAHDAFSTMAAVAYAAGRPMGYVKVGGTKMLTDNVVDTATGKTLPGVARVSPLSSTPRVIDLSVGAYQLVPTQQAAAKLCSTPYYADAIDLLTQKGIVAVAPSGNVDDEYRDLQLDQQDSGGIITVIPGECPDVYEVGGADLESNEDSERAVNDAGAVVPGRDDAYWERFETHVMTTNSPFEDPLEMLLVQGTSVAAPQFAATIAMMLAIDPTLDRAGVDELLRAKTVTFKGSPDVRMVPASVIWFKVMRRVMAKQGEPLDPGSDTGTNTGTSVPTPTR